MALLPIAEQNLVLASESMIFPLFIHAGIWSAIGAAGGLAFGLGLDGRATAARAILGGFAGALLGTIGYELVGGLAFPMSMTTQPLSATWGTRLLARLAVTVPSAYGASWAAGWPTSTRPGARGHGADQELGPLDRGTLDGRAADPRMVGGAHSTTSDPVQSG
jgi:hypothetical protein